ncbi:MAG TPA: universal stress protein [Bryobacteraceae bacterium]|jgi:nucleotide-binding universal stress UspA family protein
MPAIRHILVPVVFSSRCAWAVRYAARIAKEFKARLLFLHVGQQSEGKALDDFVARYLGDISAKTNVVDGDPADRIVELARESKTDLIVMPTYMGRFRTFLIGSVTAKVLHDADCPVLTGVHRYDDSPCPPEKFQNLICALDESPGCVSLLHWASDLAQSLSAQLKFVHAMPAVDEYSENCGEVEIRRYFLNQARSRFATLLAAEPGQPSIDLRGGEVTTVIRDAALFHHADLVIIGRGHANRALGLLRTGTYSIVRNSPCPVISV